MYINIYYIVDIKESKERMIPNHSCINLTSRYWEYVNHWIQKLYGSKIMLLSLLYKKFTLRISLDSQSFLRTLTSIIFIFHFTY